MNTAYLYTESSNALYSEQPNMTIGCERVAWNRYRAYFLKMGIILSLSSVLVIVNYTSHNTDTFTSDIPLIEEPDFMLTPPPTVHEQKKMPPPPRPKIVVSEVLLVDEDSPSVPDEQDMPDQPSKSIVGPTSDTVDNFTSPPIVRPILKDEVDNDEALIFVDRMPIYGDCAEIVDEAERRSCSASNIMEEVYGYVKYPPLAKEEGIQGTVVVSFVVDKQGDLIDITILRDIGGGCGDEVKRVIKKLGKFLPGKHNGRPVAVQYRLPVRFTLQ